MAAAPEPIDPSPPTEYTLLARSVVVADLAPVESARLRRGFAGVICRLASRYCCSSMVPASRARCSSLRSPMNLSRTFWFWRFFL